MSRTLKAKIVTVCLTLIESPWDKEQNQTNSGANWPGGANLFGKMDYNNILNNMMISTC